MASVNITAGHERLARVSGIKADGTPGELDQSVALELATVGGDSQVRQSSQGHDLIVLGAPTESEGDVTVGGDGDAGPGVHPLSATIHVVGTHDSSNDSTAIGVEFVGDEAPLNSIQ